MYTFNTQFTVNEHGFIEVPITDTILREAEKKAEYIGILNNSIRKGKGNVVGIIGEIAFRSSILNLSSIDSYDYDIISHDGLRLEVKTKDRTVKPLPHYECSVAASNTEQMAEQYVFVSTYRVGTEFKTAYVLGYVGCKDYYNMATHLNKGDYDPSNNFYVKAECYNLQINKLKKFNECESFSIGYKTPMGKIEREHHEKSV